MVEHLSACILSTVSRLLPLQHRLTWDGANVRADVRAEV